MPFTRLDPFDVARTVASRSPDRPDETPVVLWTTDEAGRCVFVDATWEDLTGTPAAGALGDGWAEVIHPDDRARVAAGFQAAVEARRPVRMEYRIRRRDGAWRWCIAPGAPRFASDGAFIGHIGSLVDVHDRREDEARLRASLAELETIYRSVPVGLAVHGPDLRWVRVNDRLAAMHGHPVEAHIGRRIGELVPDVAADVERVLRHVLDTGEATRDVEIVGHAPGPDGLQRTWLTSHLPVRDATGRVLGVNVVVEEITARRAHERELERLRAQADAANAAKSRFVATMSHELRTPLNAIQGHVHLLLLGLHGPLTDAQRHALERIQVAERHLVALVGESLDLARLEAGRERFACAPVAVAAVVERVVPLVEAQAAGAGVSLALDVDPAHVVHADAERLGQVLVNLLANAIRFTPAQAADGTPGRVAVRTTRTGARVAIEVADTGVGIEAARQAEIFDPFVQVHDRAVRGDRGSGLGLAIARELVRGMDGEIAVTSRPGTGSTFTVTLPAIG